MYCTHKCSGFFVCHGHPVFLDFSKGPGFFLTLYLPLSVSHYLPCLTLIHRLLVLRLPFFSSSSLSSFSLSLSLSLFVAILPPPPPSSPHSSSPSHLPHSSHP